jgi:uncharacterized protein (DUF1800 family)
MALIPQEQWSARHARHLINRAGFGIPFPGMAELMDAGAERAASVMVDFEPGPRSKPPSFVIEPRTRAKIREAHPGADDATLQLIYQEYQREERRAVQRLQAWWLERMYTARHPLQEKMALFWHGHFATSAQKVKSSLANWQLNDIFRAHGTGNVKSLTIGVGQSVAMLEYLDNRKSTKDAPNENWARELMELFTLGQGHYTEEDIRESARAFTGWTCDRSTFFYAAGKHDDGMKTFMGRTGNFDGRDIIDIIFEQPASAEFIAGKLWAFFAGTGASPEIARSLGATLRDSGYALRPMLKEMFSCAAFYAPEVMGAQIKSPVQFVLRLCHDLGIAPPYAQLPRATRALGQDLFYPPNVKGWEGNRAWINANHLLVRANLPAVLLEPRAARRNKAVMDAMANEEMEAMAPAEMDGNTMMATDGKGKEGGAGPRRPRERVFSTLDFTTAGGCIDAMAARFLSVPLGAPQRAALLSLTGAQDEAQQLGPADLSQRQRIALLRVITSMAEYQLC